MEFNFNIYAMSNPQTQEEVLALLDEALREADELKESLDELFRTIQRIQDSR